MSEADVPAKTRGFLFCDLRGYSAFVERHGDRTARELLTRYRRIVRDVIGRFGGAEIRTEGDSFYVVFESVSQAVEAGLAVQAALAEDTSGVAIQAGIGVHAGEVEDDVEQGIVSGAVNIAARICSVANAGEVLVSETVRGLTRGYLDVSFVPRGRRKLKGIHDPVAVYGVTRGHTLSREPGRPRWIPLGIAAAVVLFSIGVVAIALQPGSARLGDVPQNEPPVASTLGSSATSASADVDIADGLTNAERANLAYIASDATDTCGPASPEDGPRFRDVGGLAHGAAAPIAEMPTYGGIHCEYDRLSGATSVWVWELGRLQNPSAPVNAEEWIFSHAGQVNATRGTCAPDSVPVLEEWSFSGRSGLLLCFASVSGDAIVYWTFQGRNVLGKAIRDDRDMARLLDWWRAEARLAGP